MASSHSTDGGRSFRVQGHGILASVDGSLQSESESDSTVCDDMTSQVMAINKGLVQQIDALRLRLEIDYKHHTEQRAALVTNSNEKLVQRSHHISNLQSKLQEKGEVVDDLESENVKKSAEISALQKQIEDLRRDVGDAKIYAEQLQTEVILLQSDKGKLKNGSAYKEKDEEIRCLQVEVDFLKRNLNKMDKELSRAKIAIAQQGVKLRLFDNDKTNSELKFKDDLKKVTQTVRLEIEKLRDVMRGQWEEMKELREQNNSMRNDIKEIREMLVGEQTSPSKAAPTKGNTTLNVNVGVFKPSLQNKKDLKRGMQGPKKFN